MKVVILAGGFGTRLSEYTHLIPKPMVEIGGRPILWHIMNIYASQGFDDFVIALGYKGEIIKEYFLNYYAKNSDFTIDLANNSVSYINKHEQHWKVTLIDTGDDSLTGGRVKRLSHVLTDENFMLTYGDAVSDIDIKKLVAFHNDHGKKVTVTAVHPPARFGELTLDGNKVTNFKEKPQTNAGWINGGFFVCNKDFLKYIEGDFTVLEKEPLENVATEGELMAFFHEGFWQSMDTVRDKNVLEKHWDSGKAPWKVWE